MERKASLGRLSAKTLAQALIWCTAFACASAADGPIFVVAVEARLSDGSSRRGQAFAVANQANGIVLVTANTVVRTEQPDQRTRSVTGATRGDVIDELETAAISLAEFRDAGLNLAMLYGRNGKLDDWPDTACLNSELPAGREVTIVRRVFASGELKPVSGRVMQGFDAGRTVVQIAKSTPLLGELMGAPVLIGNTFVGMVIGQQTRELDVVLSLTSASEVARFLAGYLIQPQFQPSTDCLWSLLHLPPDVYDLRQRLRGILVAQRSFSNVFRSFTPTDADLVALFGSAAAGRARTELGRVVSDLAKEAPIPPIKDGVLTNCYRVNAGTTGEVFDPPITIQLKTDALECAVLWEDADSGKRYNLVGNFIFINGHWIWLSGD